MSVRRRALRVQCSCAIQQQLLLRGLSPETGAGHLTIAAVPDAAVEVTGVTATYSKAGDSGQLIERTYCPQCGSTLFARPHVLPGITMLRAGTLDDSSTLTPRVNVYASSATAWDPPSPALRGFPQMPPRRR
jgi:hypothetical protein